MMVVVLGIPVWMASSQTLILNLKIFNVYLFLRETACEQGRSRERETEFKAGFALSAQNLMQGSNSRTVRSWPELKLDTQMTEPRRRPFIWSLKRKSSILFPTGLFQLIPPRRTTRNCTKHFWSLPISKEGRFHGLKIGKNLKKAFSLLFSRQSTMPKVGIKGWEAENFWQGRVINFRSCQRKGNLVSNQVCGWNPRDLTLGVKVNQGDLI